MPKTLWTMRVSADFRSADATPVQETPANTSARGDGNRWFDIGAPFRSISAPPLGDRLTVGLQTLTLPV
jgi:hypothetical protein